MASIQNVSTLESVLLCIWLLCLCINARYLISLLHGKIANQSYRGLMVAIILVDMSYFGAFSVASYYSTGRITLEITTILVATSMCIAALLLTEILAIFNVINETFSLKWFVSLRCGFVGAYLIGILLPHILATIYPVEKGGFLDSVY
jgi:hypothetical protein